MRLLVLGGGAFVGRAVVDVALRQGWVVTTFHWDPTLPVPADVEHIHGDRRRAEDLVPLGGRDWDLVVDTWRGDTSVVRASAKLLADHAQLYGYVSSLTVYRTPAPGPFTEEHALLPVSPGLAGEPYGARKAAAEREIRAAFGGRALIARAGLILGPHEYTGRLPWWLLRLRGDSPILAPGVPDRPVQFVDVRDLAAWMLARAAGPAGGTYHVTCPRGTTMADLLTGCRQATGSRARLHWVADARLLRAGVAPWVDVPLWIPWRDDEADAYHVDVTRVLATGARFRPAQATIEDVWRWLRDLDATAWAAALDRRPWLSRAREAELLG